MTEIETYLNTNGIPLGDDEYSVTPETALEVAKFFGYQVLRPESCITLTTDSGVEVVLHQATVH